MTNFLVRFWYNTDLRWQEKVRAANEMEALGAAMVNMRNENHLSTANWCQYAGFHIEIKMEIV